MGLGLLSFIKRIKKIYVWGLENTDNNYILVTGILIKALVDELYDTFLYDTLYYDTFYYDILGILEFFE